MKESPHNFTVKLKSSEKNEEIFFDNNGAGYPVKNGVDYITIGKIPVTVRYSDYNLMFKKAVTVIIQYAEEPAEVTVADINNIYSKTLLLSGRAGYNDVGVFRLYS